MTPLVKKVGQPQVSAYGKESKKLLEETKDQLLEASLVQQELKRRLDEERLKPPEIVEVEVPVEKLVEKEVIVKIDRPDTLQVLADLELENQSIQHRLSTLKSKTSVALQELSNEHLALQRTLEQTVKDLETKSSTLDSITNALQGKWPWMRKKTLRRLLKEK